VRFEVQGTAPIDDPTPEQVERGLRTFVDDSRDFAILERQPMTYLQTAPNGDGAYLLEYQDGSLDRHYQASRPLRPGDLVAAFNAYLGEDAGWRSRHEWQPLDLRPQTEAQQPRGGSRSAVRLALYVVLGLVFLIVALGSLWNGIAATMAGSGAAGVPGRALVTSCTGRYGDACTGLFIASNGEVPPSSVSVAGGPYRTPVLVPDLRLLNGQAYPPAGSMVADLVVDYVVSVLALAGAAGCATLILRRRTRSAQSVA
jgi:hypothetical protein